MSGVALAMLGAVSQGGLWGLMGLGVYITYKIYSIWKLLVLLAPLIVYGITYIIKEKRGD